MNTMDMRIGFDMAIDLDQLRADYRTVSAHNRKLATWTAEDELEIGQAIKAALADTDLAQCWADWLASEAEYIRREQARYADALQRMRQPGPYQPPAMALARIEMRDAYELTDAQADLGRFQG